MAERSSLTQVVQWGVETSGGTSATPDTLMSALSFEPSPETSGGDFRPAGRKFKTLAWVGKEWTTGNVSGQATYTEIIYPFASVLNAPTTASVDTGVWAYEFIPSATAPDTPRTFSIAHGEDSNWNLMTGAIINELSMSFTRDQVELSGSAYGRAIENNATSLPATAVAPASTMLLPAEVSVYWADTYAGVTGSPAPSGAKLDRVLSCDFSIGDRYNPVWVLDAAQDSYVASVEGEPTLSASLMMEADAEGMERLAELKNSSTRFLRINAVSTTAITGSYYYEFDLYMAVKVADTGGFSDADGVYAVEWSCVGIYDSSLGSAVRVVIQNDMDPSVPANPLHSN